MTLLALERRMDAAPFPAPVASKSLIAKVRRVLLVFRREVSFSALHAAMATIWANLAVAAFLLYGTVAGALVALAAVVQFLIAYFHDSLVQKNRAVEDIALFDNGVMRPARYRKLHPERVRAYEEFADELNISINPNARRLSKNAHLYEAASLVLSGRVAAEDSHLISTVLARGVTDREEIAAVVLTMKYHGNALAQGSL